MDWERHRRPDGSIDLYSAWQSLPGKAKTPNHVGRYLSLVEQLQPINSRQGAAIAIATAQALLGTRG